MSKEYYPHFVQPQADTPQVQDGTSVPQVDESQLNLQEFSAQAQQILADAKFLYDLAPNFNKDIIHQFTCHVYQKNQVEILAIRHADFSALISFYGGQLLSWYPRGTQADVIFTSEVETYQGGKGQAIRGGVPVCYPWFGKVRSPAHGHARDEDWRVSGWKSATPENGQIGDFRICLAYEGEDGSNCHLQFFFVGKSLTLTFTHDNPDQELVNKYQGEGTHPALGATGALHTYFRISDIASTKVVGLPTDQIAQLCDGKALQTVALPSSFANLQVGSTPVSLADLKETDLHAPKPSASPAQGAQAAQAADHSSNPANQAFVGEQASKVLQQFVESSVAPDAHCFANLTLQQLEDPRLIATLSFAQESQPRELSSIQVVGPVDHKISYEGLTCPIIHQIHDAGYQRMIQVTQLAATDCVFWNPWTATPSKMSPEAYKQMICIETARISECFTPESKHLVVRLDLEELPA